MAKFRPVRGTLSPELQVSELLRHAEQVDRVPIMLGQLVEASWPFTEGGEGGDSWPTSQIIRHSLGRPYVGGFIAGTTGPGDTEIPVFTVVHPEQATARGTDTARDFELVTSSTLTTSVRVRVWIF